MTTATTLRALAAQVRALRLDAIANAIEAEAIVVAVMERTLDELTAEEQEQAVLDAPPPRSRRTALIIPFPPPVVGDVCWWFRPEYREDGS